MARKARKRKGGHRRGGRRGKRGRGFYKSADKRGQVMVNRTPARQHNVIAPHYYTRLESGFNGVLSSSATTTQSFNFAFSTLYEPYNTVNSNMQIFTAMSGASLVPATVTLANLQPAGFPNLVALYSSYRVYASKIQITFSPTALGDLLLLAVFPVNQDFPLNQPYSIEQAMSLPYAKCIQCSANNDLKQNTIQMYMDTPTILGLTKQQFQDYGPNTQGNINLSGTNTQPTQLGYWCICYQTYSGSAPSANIGVEVRMTQYCELFDLEQDMLITGTDQP